MAGIVFVVGVLAALAAVVDSTFRLGLPIGFAYHPFFWVAFVAILALVSSVRFVRQAQEVVIERLGRYYSTLPAGINFVVPLLDRVAYDWDMREQTVDVPAQEATTKDNVTVTVDGVLYYRIVNSKDASYGAQNLEFAITQLAMTNMRSAIGGLALDQTFEEREQVNSKIVTAITEAAATWGVQVTRYEIKDIRMPQSVQDAMILQMEAERRKRADILASEGQRQSEINRADGERQAKILEAEGDKAAAIARAEGQARAIALVREQIIATGGDMAVQLEVAKAAVEQFGNIARQGNTLVLQGDSATPAGVMSQALSVLGAINGTQNGTHNGTQDGARA
jgi:regulator of protease activity HflC (stomatin/prohibitin superfamily)